MNYTSTLINQIAMMFAIMALGFILKRRNVFSDQFVKELSALLYLVIGVANVVDAFLIESSPEKLKLFFICAGISLLIYICAIIISGIFFSKGNHQIERYGTIITNSGFLGLPLVMAVCGSEYKFYVVPFVVINILIQNTYGVYLYTKDKNYITLKSILLNATLIGTVVGLIIFLFSIPVPQFLKTACSSLSACVAPLVSIIIGANLSNSKLEKFKEDKLTLLVVLLRQIVIPLIGIGLLSFVSNDYLTIKIALLIMIGTPCAASTSAFARLYDNDYDKASRVVCVSTISFILTISLILQLALKVW